jgi:WD40 repeat protein/serine/threonine protein kinase
MVGVYRCSCGHIWKAAASDPRTCPACGITPPLAEDPTSHDHTQHFPPATEPSFASLAGLPDPFAVTRDGSTSVDDEVPIGPSPPTQEFRGSPVPGYELHEELGRGGMGVVYRATQTALNRPVALKMILSGSHAGPVERERFRREAQAVAALQHPNIVQIFEIGESNGHAYLALELVEGGSLAQHLSGTPWSARDSAQLVELLARAVQYAHDQGVIHRDLKPGNILLAKERGLPNALQSARNAVPKVTDFGLAKRIDETVAPDGATKTGAVMGTPSYIAPEQAAGKTREIGPAVDVYALGAILYELLTGRPPFRGETPLDTVLQVINEDPVAPKSLQPNIPWDLQTICLACLAKSPAKRYPSARALADDLRRYLNGEPILARPLGSWGRTVKWARRHPVLAVLALTSIITTVGIVTVLSIAYSRVSEAVKDRENEAAAAHAARLDEQAQRKRAEKLAEENEKARTAAVEQAAELKRESERNRRGAYALQIAQIAALVERDPRRAQTLLEDANRCPPDLRDFAWAYLHRLCIRDDRIYAEHAKGDELSAIAVSRGAVFVATGSWKGHVRIWDPRTGRTYAVPHETKSRITGLAFSPDGEMLAASCADGTIHIWEFPAQVLDLARRTVGTIGFLTDIVRPAVFDPVLVLAGPGEAQARCVTFSPDGRRLVAGYSNGDVRSYNMDVQRPNPLDIAALGGPAAVGLSRTQKRNLSPLDGATSGTWATGHGPIESLAYSASGRLLAVGLGDRRVAVVTGREGRPILSAAGNASHSTIEAHAAPVSSLAFTPDERTLVTVNNGATPTIRLFDTQTLREERRLIGHLGAILSVAVSADGTLLASGSVDGTVRLWDLEEGRERATLTGTGLVRSVAFGADRRTVLSAGADGIAHVWLTGMRPNESADVTTSREVQITSASHDAHGRLFVFADSNGRLLARLADVVNGRYQPRPGLLSFALINLTSPVKLNARCAAVSPPGNVLFAATDDHLLLWRLGRPKAKEPGGLGVLAFFAVPVRVPARIRQLAATSDGSHLVSLDSESLRVWDLREAATPFGPKTIPVPEPILKNESIQSFLIHPDGKHIAVAIGRGVRLIDLAGNTVAELPQEHGAAITAMAFDPEGSHFATGDAAGVIRVWSMKPDFSIAHQVDLAGHTSTVASLDFTPGARTLASGGYDRTIMLWDPETGQERMTLTGHADRLLSVQFTPDGHTMISISRDGTVKRWRAEPRTDLRPEPKYFPFPRQKRE